MATSSAARDGERCALYVEELRREFPQLRFAQKRGDGFSLAVDRALRVVTLGGQSAYLTRYVTTVGQTIYFPDGWEARDDVERYCVLRHEAVHLRQFRRYGRLGMALLYLVPILPLGLAWGRARLEWEGYAETLRATAEQRGVAALDAPEFRAHILAQFTGPAYGWMWPFPRVVSRWYDAVVAELRSTELSAEGVEPRRESV